MDQTEFSGVKDTLFIPLAARVLISGRFPDFFMDKKAMRLKELPQITKINEKSFEYAAMASVCRYKCMDQWVRDYLSKRPHGKVFSLGVGLETMIDRLDAPETTFYSVDFPEVIESRKKVLGTRENEVMIGADITDPSWIEQADTSAPALFVVSGVFQYFKKEGVIALIHMLQDNFKDAELIFDATNEYGIQYAQKYVKKTGNQEAMMYFYIDDPAQFAEEVGVSLLETRGFFKEAREQLGRRMKLFTRVAMKVADGKNRTILLRVKL